MIGEAARPRAARAIVVVALAVAAACHGNLSLRATACDGFCGDGGDEPFACATRAVLRIESSAGTQTATFDPASRPSLAIAAARPATVSLALFGAWSLPSGTDGKDALPLAAGIVTVDALDGRDAVSADVPLRCTAGCPARASLRVHLRDFDRNTSLALPADATVGAIGPAPAASNGCTIASEPTRFFAFTAVRETDGWRGPLPATVRGGCLAVRLTTDGAPDDLCLAYADGDALTAAAPSASRRRDLRALLDGVPRTRGTIAMGLRSASGLPDGGAQVVFRDRDGITHAPSAWLAPDGTLQPTAPTPHGAVALFTDAESGDYVVELSSGERRTFTLAADEDAAAITWFVAAP
jgi:hypothetical protein